MPKQQGHRVIVEVHGGLVTDVMVPDQLVLPLLVRDYETDGIEEKDLYFDAGDIDGGEYFISDVSTVDAEREYEAELVLSVHGGVVDVERKPDDVAVEIRDYDCEGCDDGALVKDPDGVLMVRSVY
jgi:hypothetical protein